MCRKPYDLPMMQSSLIHPFSFFMVRKKAREHTWLSLLRAWSVLNSLDGNLTLEESRIISLLWGYSTEGTLVQGLKNWCLILLEKNYFFFFFEGPINLRCNFHSMQMTGGPSVWKAVCSKKFTWLNLEFKISNRDLFFFSPVFYSNKKVAELTVNSTLYSFPLRHTDSQNYQYSYPRPYKVLTYYLIPSLQ